MRQLHLQFPSQTEVATGAKAHQIIAWTKAYLQCLGEKRAVCLIRRRGPWVM